MKSCNLKYILLFSLLLLFLPGCGGPEENADARIESPEKVVSVSVERVQPVDLEETFTLPAGLEAWEDLVISAEIAGPVRKFNYQEGDRVKSGATLLEIDPDTLKSSLEREEQNFATTQRKLKRFRDLAREGLVSEQEVEDLENALTAADMALKATRLQLAKCYPKAPVSGVVDLHYVDRGEYVDPGKPLLRLVQVDKLKAIADVPEKDVPFLQVDQQVEVIPAIINNRQAQTLTGRIEHIAFSADATTRTYRTKISIDNKKGELRPGMIVRARFVRQQLSQVVSAPLFAVLDRDGEKLVFVEENGIAKRQNVETGSSVDQRIVIRSGLEPGQRLIVKGQQLLIDGAKVALQEN
ncbi:membrane fusion protein, multidrug efflux system [Malonomonas rubra DSM 5091]|uniref:Membrane fusion protein, multidrug efflux system n=1 Tax=Malonomonas rubra DSM 5091 TaxID=1122189 RepID=A0A1M6LHB5_MALRU|nr:efflux RND transporter periplasmic adaptor subunit [Malonomonas rubra]SHJ70538.1 membrane fusion protein, multidrug efflux system [Malonomonas rubra DSM 5091]